MCDKPVLSGDKSLLRTLHLTPKVAFRKGWLPQSPQYPQIPGTGHIEGWKEILGGIRESWHGHLRTSETSASESLGTSLSSWSLE